MPSGRRAPLRGPDWPLLDGASGGGPAGPPAAAAADTAPQDAKPAAIMRSLLASRIPSGMTAGKRMPRRLACPLPADPRHGGTRPVTRISCARPPLARASAAPLPPRAPSAHGGAPRHPPPRLLGMVAGPDTASSAAPGGPRRVTPPSCFPDGPREYLTRCSVRANSVVVRPLALEPNRSAARAAALTASAALAAAPSTTCASPTTAAGNRPLLPVSSLPLPPRSSRRSLGRACLVSRVIPSPRATEGDNKFRGCVGTAANSGPPLTDNHTPG